MINTTLSPKPLFDWFDQDKTHRAKFRQEGYSDGRITNWKRRGIPRAEVGNIAQLMGWTYEQYVTAAELAERRVKTWRRAAALAALSIGVSLFGVDNKVIAAPFNPDFAYKNNTLHIVRRLLRRIFSFLTNTYTKLDNEINAIANKIGFPGKTEGWTRHGQKPV